MTEIAVGSETVNAEDWMPSKIYLSVPLMWDILQFNCTLESQESFISSPLSQSIAPTFARQEADETSTLEVIVATLPDVTVDTADGGLGRPMLSVKAPVASVSESSRNTMSNDAYDTTAVDSLTLNTTPWLWADPSQSGDMNESGYSNLSFAIGNAENALWWDLGNFNNTTFNQN